MSAHGPQIRRYPTARRQLYTKMDGLVSVYPAMSYTQYRCRLYHPPPDEVAAILLEVRDGARARNAIAADHQLTRRRLNLLLKKHAPELIGARKTPPAPAPALLLSDEEVDAILAGCGCGDA